MKQVTSKTKIFGKKGEEKIVIYLKKQGFVILEQNFFCRYGELDIIAFKKELLICVEVKTRHNKDHLIHEIISYSKQQKMIKTASYYYSTFSKECVIRFDVAFVCDDNIEYIENAFTSEK